MNIVFVEPAFPESQRRFVQALRAVGAYVMVISEHGYDGYDDQLKSWIDWHYRIDSVTDEAALEWAVRQAQRHTWVDRLECTIESHVLPVAKVRERCGIPGTSARAASLCRDRAAMNDVLREAGIPAVASVGVDSLAAAQDFVRSVGYPVILRPREATGVAGSFRADDEERLSAASAASGLDGGASVVIEELVSGHEGFLDTLTINGQVVHEFISHCFPNVDEAMRTRWISPQVVTTNRVMEPEYEEIRSMARRVIGVLGVDTSATHITWFAGPGGPRIARVDAHPPGVGQWDMHNEANEMDLHHEWAHALAHGGPRHHPSRRYSCGVVALRPNRDGMISGCSGVDEIRREYGESIIAEHVPSPGSRTRPVDAGYYANAWLRVRHPDFDTTREILSDIGRTVQLWAD